MAACGIAPEDDDGNMATKAFQEAARPPKPTPKPVEPDPKPTAPVKIEGKDTPWQLKVSAHPNGDHGEWSHLVIDATALQFQQAQTEDDVMNIFKTNRNIYDELKRGSPDAYNVMMDEFKQARAKHKEAK
jgi:hypothetical protein